VAIDLLGSSLFVSGLVPPADPTLENLERKQAQARFGSSILAVNRAAQVITAPGAVRTTIESSSGMGSTTSTKRVPPKPTDIAQSTTVQVYATLGWNVNELSDGWQLDVATVRAHLAEGVLPSSLVRAARAGAPVAKEGARLSQILALGLKAMERNDTP
jgi:hypothetical protein